MNKLYTFNVIIILYKDCKKKRYEFSYLERSNCVVGYLVIVFSLKTGLDQFRLFYKGPTDYF